MKGPVTDIVRLVLLLLFFGIQQRSRPHSYVRFWFVGWIFVFLSYMAWVVRVVQPALVHLQSAVSFDFMLLGVLTFLLALLATEQQRVRKIVLAGAAIGVVNVLIIDAQQFMSVPRVLLVLAILAWQSTGFFTAYHLLPRRWPRTRGLILAICVVYGIAMLAYVVMTPANNLDSWAVAEVLLCTAVLYRKWGDRRSISRWVGTVGFVAWASLYFVNLLLVDSPQAQKVLYEFWNLPKYCVACTMILKVFEDATAEQSRMADSFRELYEDFRLIYDSHPYPMWIYDAGTEKFLATNTATLKEYGYSLEELLGMRMAELEPSKDEVEEIESALGETSVETRLRLRHKDGRVVWVNIVERGIMYLGREARFVIARDITEQLKLGQELSHRAHHDALTGLPNRKLMEDRLQQSLKTCEREGKKAALLTIDVDHFKLINDTYGHLVGDECLREVAARLKTKIRKVDTIARTGGEEFMAIVGGLSHASDAEKVTAALLAEFEAPVVLAFGELGVTVSIGVAVFPDDATDAETLRRLSDEALYAAKRGGRSRAAYAFDAGEVGALGDLKMDVRSVEGSRVGL